MREKSERAGSTGNARPLRIFRRADCAVAPPDAALQQCACSIYKREGARIEQSTSLVFCSDYVIRSLNARYRRVDRATDVLSFVMADPDLLGEIYLSVERAAVQSRRFGSSFEEEILRLFIHGLFHLLGYDHETETERAKMERKERRSLSEALKLL
jgi:probable rRNA maturation factor